MNLIKIGLSGASGKVGRAIQTLLKKKNKQFILTAKINSTSTEEHIRSMCSNCDVIIDFSSPEALEKILYFAVNFSKNIIIGTTGLNSQHICKMESAAKKIAILYAANTSFGANLLQNLSTNAAKILKDYDIEIVETHHRDKNDAPSGTALTIGKAIAKEKKIIFDQHAIYNRYQAGKRQNNDISFSSIRAGGIFGEHHVIFANEDEVITISHRALSRSAFAQGAVDASAWILNKTPGLYSINDLLATDHKK